MIHVLTIHGWTPTRLNQLLGNRRKAARLKRRDRQIVAVYARLQAIPKAEARRKVTIEITFAKGDRAGDPDCWFKSALDALKHAGLLKDDTNRWVELAHPIYLPESTRHRTDKRMTRIFLEDV